MSHVQEGFLNAAASQIVGAAGIDKVVRLEDALAAVESARADMKKQLDEVAAHLSHKLAEREVFALTLIQSLAAGVSADEEERLATMVKSILEHGKFDSVPGIFVKALSLATDVSGPAQAAMAKASTIVMSYLQATHAAVAAEADKAKQQHGLDVQSFYQAIASADLVKLKDKSGKPLGEWVITSVKTEFHDFSKKRLFTITAQMPLDMLGDVVSAAASGVKHFAEAKLPPFASASNVDAAPPKPAPAPVVGPSGIPNWVPRFVDGELVVDSSSDQLDELATFYKLAEPAALDDVVGLEHEKENTPLSPAVLLIFFGPEHPGHGGASKAEVCYDGEWLTMTVRYHDGASWKTASASHHVESMQAAKFAAASIKAAAGVVFTPYSVGEGVVDKLLGRFTVCCAKANEAYGKVKP